MSAPSFSSGSTLGAPLVATDFLSHLHNEVACQPLAQRALALIADLYPICRSITGQGVRTSLRRLAQEVPLRMHDVASGTQVLDWEIPLEWNIRDAYVADETGKRLIDFRRHSLHVLNYSTPVRARMRLSELRPHLHTQPDRPDWIPYRTSYWREQWGFCLSQRQLDEISAADAGGEYEVVIDSDLKPGSLSYAEFDLPGVLDDEVVIFTHICHPSLANDNASGMAVAALLAAEVARAPRRLSYRFVFAPATIGSITWLAKNEAAARHIRAGLVIGLLGDSAPLTYKRSRRGNAEIDYLATTTVRALDPAARVEEFSPYGYDERQFCSPGFNLPLGRLTRSGNDTYPEYHTSADNLALMRVDALAQSICALARIVSALDRNVHLRNTSPHGEPRLGKHGLFRSTGGSSPQQFDYALLWLLNQADGSHGVLDIAAHAGIDVKIVQEAATALIECGLLEDADSFCAPCSAAVPAAEPHSCL